MYDLIQAAENTYYIDCPAKMGIYRMADNGVILIDSGNDKEAGRKILKIITENAWTLDTIINTHSNADHIGGNRFLAERTGCKIFANGIERAFCEFPILEPSFLFGGFPNGHLRHKFLLAEGSSIGDIKDFIPPPGMGIIPLKGHFFDMIGVKTPDNVYFLADCVSSEAVLKKYPISYIYDVAEHLKTLDFIETLEGELFIPAHTEAVKDIKPLATANRQKVYEIIDGIKSICEAPSSFEVIMKKMFDKYDAAMNFSQYALVGSTIKSYLSYMLDNKILEAEINDNFLLWKLCC